MLGSPAEGAAAEPLTLEPSSPWIADFKDESCAIRRSFAGAGQNVTLEFDNFLLGNSFDVVIAGVTLQPRKGTVRGGFEPEEEYPELTGVVTGDFTNRGKGVMFSSTVFRAKRSQQKGRKPRRQALANRPTRICVPAVKAKLPDLL